VDAKFSPVWRLLNWKEIYSSLNHCEVKKAEPSPLMARKLEANREFMATVRFFYVLS